MASNDQAGIKIRQHRTFKERLAAAQNCCSALDMKIPLLIDGIDDSVCNQYSGHPDRVYIIDSEGKVSYKAGRGPFGFIPGEVEQALAMLLIEEAAPKPSEP
jgi:hypothetical protein